LSKHSAKHGKDGAKQIVTQIELSTQRDDGWMNSYMLMLMCHWQANMDVPLTIDLGNIIQYMAKYVTEAKSTMTKGGSSLIQQVIKDNLDNGSTVKTVLKKAMNQLMGEPVLTMKHATKLPAIRQWCSHTFVAVNMKKDAPLSPSKYFMWSK
jgi:hypothetical protein